MKVMLSGEGMKVRTGLISAGGARSWRDEGGGVEGLRVEERKVIEEDELEEPRREEGLREGGRRRGGRRDEVRRREMMGGVGRREGDASRDRPF